MDTHKRRQLMVALLIMIIVASSFSVFFAYRLLFPPAYKFKTGMEHPQAISDLMKNGTVVVFFTENESICPPCANMMLKIADLQSQYPKVTFATFTSQENKTSLALFSHYGIEAAPQIFVIRSDGAVAKFVGQQDDITPIKSAIEEAQHGKSSNIFPF